MPKLKVTRKIKPGKPGTLKEMRRYGERLLSVRYLKDEEGRYIKTAEIIVYERGIGLDGIYMDVN
jgi:hypothetical protein